MTALLLVGVPRPGHAATVTVDATGDTADPDPAACDDASRPCTLRDAVSAANASDDQTRIELPAGTYQVEHGSLEVAHDLSVVGLADSVVLDGPDASLFEVDHASLTLVGLTVTDSGFFESVQGAAVHFTGDADDDLELVEVALHRNDAGRGGAIYADGWNQLTITRSTIDGNTTAEGGTALWLEDSTGSGGALDVLIENSTISGNWDAEALGLNTAVDIPAAGASTTIRNSTIVDNVEPGSGSDPTMGTGLHAAGEVVLVNTIVAGHARDCSGEVTSAGHNIASDGSCGLDHAGDQPHTDPQLAELADNGGPTRTHALGPASPAHTAADPAHCPDIDQRGLDRREVCDVGAFELQVQADRPTPNTSLHATYQTASGWEAHLAGDITGDGRPELFSFHPSNGRWYVTGEDGDPTHATSYQTRTGWTAHVLGEVVSRGGDTLLSFYDDRKWVFTTFDEQGRRSDRGEFTRYESSTSNMIGWDGHVTGDVTGDGRDELLSYHAGHGHWVATTGDDERHVVTEYRTADGWKAHLAADITGGGHVDLLSYHGNGRWFISSWDEDAGSYTTSRFTTYATTDGWSGHVAADITGDGRDELLSVHTSNGQWFATSADGDRWRYARYATSSGWQAHLAADVDGDGRDDLLSYHPSNGTWWRTTADG